MKKLICAVLTVLLIAATFSGCKSEKDRILYKTTDWKKTVELGEYKNLQADTSSDDFKKVYDSIIDYDIENNGLYTTDELKSGKVVNGDVANIDYCGKKDGVAFEGGTAQGHDLEIGSNSFIPGFEDGLIGVDIGSTVDLNLKFPDSYSNSPDLAGKDVVFTVTVNSVKRKNLKTPEEYYKDLDFKSVEEYNDDVKDRAVEQYLNDKVISASNIKDYPQAEIDIIYGVMKNSIEANLKNNYNADLATYLSSVGQTEEEFKKELVENQIKSIMKQQMVHYAILDANKLTVTSEETEKRLNTELKNMNNSSITADMLKTYYGEYYFEELVVSDKVMSLISKSATIK